MSKNEKKYKISRFVGKTHLPRRGGHSSKTPLSSGEGLGVRLLFLKNEK
jgi:hypothetical protein